MWWDVSIKNFSRLSLSKQNKNELGGLVGGMKSCENCSTYFITKDAKLCKSSFFFIFKCTLIFFSYSLLPYIFRCCFACSAWSIIKPLSYLMFLSSTLIFLSSCQSLNDCERVNEREREQWAERVEEVVEGKNNNKKSGKVKGLVHKNSQKRSHLFFVFM